MKGCLPLANTELDYKKLMIKLYTFAAVAILGSLSLSAEPSYDGLALDTHIQERYQHMTSPQRAIDYAPEAKVEFDPNSMFSFPFDYKHIPEYLGGAELALISQHAAIVSTPEKPAYMLVGMLQPCIGIVLHNTRNNHILAAHKDCTNDLNSLLAFIEELDIIDPSDLKLTLYSLHYADALYNISLKSSCAYHSQEEEHALTRAFFQNELRIPSENIQDFLYQSPYADGVLGMYEFAELFLLVDPQGNINNTCIMGEDYFGLESAEFYLGNEKVDYGSLSFGQKFVLNRDTLSQINDDLFRKNIEKHNVGKSFAPEHLYGTIPFFNYYDKEDLG